MNINPWLLEKVQEYRNQNKDSVLRADYDFLVQAGSKLSWNQHLTVRALQAALKWDSFLQTIRLKMDLPIVILDALYLCHVDCVADLVQLSEEELAECARMHKFDTAPVKKYLKKHGYKLKRCNERTYKVQSLLLLPTLTTIEYKTWALNPPGSTLEFDLTRPLSFRGKWWEEKFYSQYEYTEGEDELYFSLRGVKPAPIGDLPTDYKEFFTAVQTFHKCYDAICDEEDIGRTHFILYDIPTKSKELAFIDNGDLLFTKKSYVSALISIFERTNLFKYYTPGQFLAATDEQKLNIAERESKNETFQLLLITYVELRIDFENLLWYIQSLAKKPVKELEMNEKPDPINPWLAERIMEYRHGHKEDYIRKYYISYLDENPDTSWPDFIAVAALKYKIRRDPFLMTRRKDFGFSEHLTDVMNILEVENVADLLQFTIEELSELCTQDGESVAPVVQFLAAHGYHILSYPENTLKYPLPEIENERKQQKEVIRDHCSEAEGRMKRTDEPLETRLEHALAIYRSGLHLARACDLPLKTQLSVLIDIGRLMEEHLEAFPELTKDAPEIVERAIYCSEMVHGPKGKKTAGCHRLYGAILSKLKRHDEAAKQYSAAAAIAKEYEGPEGLWLGKDLRSAAVCNTRIPDYEKALGLFFQAADVFKKHPDNPRELEETYWNIAECYHQLKDKKNEEKYRLLAAAIRTTDEI